MKKTIQVLALVLAIGATVQTIRAYSSETGYFSVEVEEYKLTKLIELRKEVDATGESAPFTFTRLSEEFPQITNHEQLNEEIARQALRYLQAIGAQEALIKVIKRPEFQPLWDRIEPGI
jgi:hypothetical protein